MSEAEKIIKWMRDAAHSLDEFTGDHRVAMADVDTMVKMVEGMQEDLRVLRPGRRGRGEGRG